MSRGERVSLVGPAGELRPPEGTYALPKPGQRVRLRVFTSSPQTLSSADVTLPTV